MRRLRVKYRPAAVDDLDELYLYLCKASGDPDTARHYVDRLLDRCRKIGHAPYGGRRRDDLEAGLRTASFERAYLRDCVRIVNIFYGGRDYETLYRNQSKPAG